jgi:hypothetical protein
MRNLLTRVPKSAQSFVATMVRTIFAGSYGATTSIAAPTSSASSRTAPPSSA